MEPSKLAECDDSSAPVTEDAKPNGRKVVFLYSVEEAAQALSGLTMITNKEVTVQNEKPVETKSGKFQFIINYCLFATEDFRNVVIRFLDADFRYDIEIGQQFMIFSCASVNLYTFAS